MNILFSKLMLIFFSVSSLKLVLSAIGASQCCLGNPDEGLQAIRKGFMKDQASMFFVYKNNYYYVFILTGEKLLLWLTRKMAHHQFTIPTARF